VTFDIPVLVKGYQSSRKDNSWKYVWIYITYQITSQRRYTIGRDITQKNPVSMAFQWIFLTGVQTPRVKARGGLAAKPTIRPGERGLGFTFAPGSERVWAWMNETGTIGKPGKIFRFVTQPLKIFFFLYSPQSKAGDKKQKQAGRPNQRAGRCYKAMPKHPNYGIGILLGCDQTKTSTARSLEAGAGVQAAARKDFWLPLFDEGGK